MFPGFVQTTPTLLFKGITLNDIENATFTARTAGGDLKGDGGAPRVLDRILGYNKRVIKDGDDVTHILVEFQSSTDHINATIVEFTNGEGEKPKAKKEQGQIVNLSRKDAAKAAWNIFMQKATNRSLKDAIPLLGEKETRTCYDDLRGLVDLLKDHLKEF